MANIAARFYALSGRCWSCGRSRFGHIHQTSDETCMSIALDQNFDVLKQKYVGHFSPWDGNKKYWAKVRPVFVWLQIRTLL